MPRRHGRLAEFHLGDSGSVLQNLTALLSNVEMPLSVETAQVTALGEDDHEQVPGVRGGNIRLTGFPDETADAFDEVMAETLGGVGGTAASAWKYFPAGSVSNRIVYSGSAFVTAYSPGGGVGGAAAATGELIIHGSVTRGTVA